MILSVLITYVHTGLVNYCVTAGEAHSKALEIARDINQKVSLSKILHAATDAVSSMICHFEMLELGFLVQLKVHI